MEFRRIWTLRGPNFWAPFPVVEAETVLGALDAFRPAQDAGFLDRLRQRFPAWSGVLDAHATLADLLQHAVIALQQQVGSEATFGQVQHTHEPGFYRVIFAYDEEALARAALEAARDLVLAAHGDTPFDAAARLTALRDLAHEVRLGPSTAAIVRAAQRRGIPTHRLNDGSLVQLGQGCNQRRIWTAETDATHVLGEVIAQDKHLTRNLAQAIGVPVPYGRPVADAEDAWRAAEEIGPPVVVKPQFGNQGRGVATNLTTREQVLQAYAAACQEGTGIVVEQFVPGRDHRVLVVGERVIAAALREPAHVIGDGRSTIEQLIAEVNRDPRRSDGHATVLSHIKIDAIASAVLAEQGCTPTSVPPAGTRVLIRRNANLSTGGTATDVTDAIHPRVALRAVDAARAVGLDIAGVDIVVEDIGQPLEDQKGAIVEVNAGPGLRMHLEPSAGKSRPVGEAIVENLFPPGQTGRIPVIAVTGVNGKTTTTRLLAHVLRQTGRFVGMTCTDGIYLNGRRTETRDCSGPHSARTVLMNRMVELAVLETARGGILREGLGFDHCDVAVVTNLGKGDHLGLRGIETLEELARVKCTLVKSVAPHGTAVLNAADPLVAAMAPHCPGRVSFFALDPVHPLLVAHAHYGGRSATVRDGHLVLTDGPDAESLLPLADIPLTHGGAVAFQIENALAAAAALIALNIPRDTIRQGLRTFIGDAEQAPGRFNVFARGGQTVIVDYAHNPSAVAALVAAVERFPQRRRSLVFSGCNRRDADLREMGLLIGRGFDRVILYRDWGHSGRSDGELNACLRQGVESGPRTSEVVELPTELEAIRLALATPSADELVVMGVDSIEEALRLVQM
ncbi:MAG: cyanophycin synthetase [Planctomycetia bacterium]|nr:cyanophycin synthetase [Planctomycetia bacterium]